MPDVIRQIINFLIRGYPLRAMRDSMLDIQKKHKTKRSIVRLIFATLGIITGIIVPNFLLPGINEYMSGILIKGLPWGLSSLNATIICTLFCMWWTTAISLLGGKYCCQLFYYGFYHDTNSSHFLSPRQTQLIAMALKNHLIFFSPDIENILSKLSNDEYFIDRVRNDFNCMIDEIKKLKKTIRFNNGSEQQHKIHIDQKKDLKAVLGAYVLSDFIPYDEYLKLYEAKRKTNQDRLFVLRQNKAKFRLLNERLNAHNQSGSHILDYDISISNSHGSNNDFMNSVIVQDEAADQSELGSPEPSSLGNVTREGLAILNAQSNFNHDYQLTSSHLDDQKEMPIYANAECMAEPSNLSIAPALTNNIPGNQLRSRRGSTSTVVQIQYYSKLSKMEMQAIQKELDKQIDSAERLAKDDNVPARRLSICQPR